MKSSVLLTLLAIVLLALPVSGQDLTVDEIINNVYERDSQMHEAITDLTMTAESFARKLSGDGDIKEEKKFIKTYYFKRSDFKIEFLEFYLDGIKQDDKALAEQIEDAKDRRKKGRVRDASIDPLTVFGPDKRADYDFTLIGVETKEGVECYHVLAACNLENDKMLEGDFWFTTDGFNPVHIEFRPSKMPSKIKKLDMKRTYAEAVNGWWLPKKFYLRGNGKVMIFIKFNFAVEEYYSGYKINSGLDSEFFKELEDED